MAEKPNCIICMQDDGYEIVGPFEPSGGGEMMAFGMKWMKEHGDDARWQEIYLADPHAPPRVISPTEVTRDCARNEDELRIALTKVRSFFTNPDLGNYGSYMEGARFHRDCDLAVAIIDAALSDKESATNDESAPGARPER